MQQARSSGLSKENTDLQIARHRVLGEFGANELFAGNGLTRVDKNSKWEVNPESIPSKKLTNDLLDEGQLIISSTSKNSQKREAALSRACVDELGVISNKYVNLIGKVPDFPGVRMLDENVFVIEDMNAYLSQVKELYAETGNTLNLVTENKTIDHIRSIKEFPIRATIPGLYAEVQSVNDVINQLPAGFDLSKIKVSTIKLAPSRGQGEPFPACFNCGGILSNSVTTLTGVK